MKKYLPLVTLAVLALLAAGCKKDDSGKNKKKGEDPISVVFLDNGSPVTGISLDNNTVRKDIGVEVNRPDLVWNIESDKPWCHVSLNGHTGSGSFTIELDANESFDDREEATLVFVAGEYRDSTFKLTQRGADCLLAQPYIIFPRLERALELDVTVKKTAARVNIECNEWINVEEINWNEENHTKTYTFKIWSADGRGNSRFGRVSFNCGGDKTHFYVYQFCGDHHYDSEEHILFPADEPSSISFKAPRLLIRSINLPSFGSYTVSDEREEYDAYTFTIEFGQNLTGAPRDIDVSVVLNNADGTTFSLPGMIQGS
ncbi:MAG: BACON domain-containing protein [Bacteroidales bacterium]|nr:BACON domain-containing protein [Bacteroidales bacterium]